VEWVNALWEIRQKYGQAFMDRAMFYTFKAWEQPIKSGGDFDQFFAGRFLAGVWIISNTGERFAEVESILDAHHLMPH
jgi:hypothetical protein